MALTVLAHSRNCENGSCPTLWQDDATGDIWVQGYLPDGAETRVRVPSAEWAFFLTQLPR